MSLPLRLKCPNAHNRTKTSKERAAAHRKQKCMILFWCLMSKPDFVKETLKHSKFEACTLRKPNLFVFQLYVLQVSGVRLMAVKIKLILIESVLEKSHPFKD